jgi:serine/threonine protein kinase
LTTLTEGATLCDGRYRLDRVLGRGGMAIVWGATDLQLERPVAIKVISDVLASDPRFVARFEREARLAAGLNHPNLVKLFDVSSESDRPFLVMEQIPGGTLADRRGDTGLDATVLARDLLDALSHIHAAGILHRDVKPANVLIGADGRPRLTDFGIARSDDQTGLTLTGQIMGTVRYIAPEVAEGRPATRQSDLYSLGVMLGEVAGPHPEPALARLLDRLRDPDPDRRPASAAEALAELDPAPPTVALDKTVALDQTNALDQTIALDPPSGASPRRHIHIRLDAVRLAAIAGIALVATVVGIVVAGGNDGNKPSKPALPAISQPRPAAPDAPLDAQLIQLQKIVDSAPKR